MPKQDQANSAMGPQIRGDDAVSMVSAGQSQPWLDRSLPAYARLVAYKNFMIERATELETKIKQAPDAELNLLVDAPDTKWMFAELAWLGNVSAVDFCREMERRQVLNLLGKNFLGAEAWRSQGIEVGEAPPIPESFTQELLNSECPLHPGEKIKDTHLLVLVPKTVNGESYSALKLDELCATRKGSGKKLIYGGDGWAIRWKSQPWASMPQSQSEWVLIPKSDPYPSKVTKDKHFRRETIAVQQTVHETHYREYREVKTVELMTAVLLNDLVNKERLVPDYLRCIEPNASGVRVCVGRFDPNGLRVDAVFAGYDFQKIGRALIRKLE